VLALLGTFASAPWAAIEAMAVSVRDRPRDGLGPLERVKGGGWFSPQAQAQRTTPICGTSGTSWGIFPWPPRRATCAWEVVDSKAALHRA
jgi:hypothetical protein